MIDVITHGAKWVYRSLSEEAVFVSMVTDILPLLISLLVIMNALTIFVDQARLYAWCSVAWEISYRAICYSLIGTFVFCNQITLSLWRFMPEKYKPSYYAAASYSCRSVSPYPTQRTVRLSG